ncbi:hypothetical protein IE53DRAFT_386809 [Violaceomyces palustris]|uniref:Uncharacterized protein n=1 Tax=Violaceomyces palustris TaxID=1673888 RepID=A0ACD0NYI0_9BASI|nr:hypothetical protein IE53DRAFT_386809 [Violaceomyces palustris]
MPSKRSSGPIKRHHAFHGVIMVLGWLLPPLAVLVRFGVGKDFFINIICTLCGYIPGHGHNFFIQNIRNNKNAKHSPSWAIKMGLVKDYKKKSNGWSDRYGENGGLSYADQDVIVDPLTGETMKDPHSSKGNVKHRTFSPWADNLNDESPRAEREDPYSSSPSGVGGRGREVRDPVTGAIIDSGDGGLNRSGSRRSLGSRYAERYGLGGGETSSHESSARESMEGSRRSLGGGLRSKASFGSLGSGGGGGKNKKKDKKNRWAREADVMGDPNKLGGGSRGGPDGYDDDQAYDPVHQGGRNGGPRSDGSTGRNKQTIRDPMEDHHEF